MEVEKYIILSDAQLVTFALDGDAVAFETLFKRYRDGIYNLCLQRTGGNTDDASDLMQETFVKVYVNLAKYDSKFTFGQWIYTIARNNFIDYVRRRRDDLSIDSLPKNSGPIAPVDGEQTPEERIISAQHTVQLEKSMASLPEKYRQMVELRFVKELSYEEIAQRLDIPIGTVKTQIHRARERLCKLITSEETQTTQPK